MKMTLATVLVFTFSMVTAAFAAEKTKAPPQKPSTQVTVEQRKNMASAHEKMAECLRSDKTIESCQKDMMQSCHEMMGKDGCPMMGQMGKMHGMMGKKGMMNGNMMGQSGQPEETKKTGD